MRSIQYTGKKQQTPGIRKKTFCRAAVAAMLLTVPLLPLAASSPEAVWESRASTGFALSHGNTEIITLTSDIFVNRNRKWVDEWTFSVSMAYSEEADAIAEQKIDGFLRYGLSLNKKFYVFARFWNGHDYAANLRFRSLPTAGAGYWFIDSKAFKAMIEAGGGYSYSRFRDASEEEQAIIQFRTMLKLVFSENSAISFDSYIFPDAADLQRYLLNASLGWQLRVSKKLSLTLNYSLEYNTNPHGNAEAVSGKYITRLMWHL